jgi:hypothetical protein
VAMSGHRVEASRLVAVEPEQGFDRLIAAPLPAIFVRRFGAFPPVHEVLEAPDEWGTVGQSRRIVLADGGRLRETLTAVDRPGGFEYRLDEITGRLRPFVGAVDGAWTVTPQDEGSLIGWSWTLYPTSPITRLTPVIIGRMWQGYAARALVEVERLLTQA